MDVPDADRLAVVIWIDDLPESFVPTVFSIAKVDPEIEIFLGGSCSFAELRELYEPMSGSVLIKIVQGTLAEVVRQNSHEFSRHILLVTAPVIFPPRAFDRSISALDENPRIASVSYLSNSAGPFSFPDRNRPRSAPIDGHDEISLTLLLRSELPPPMMVPVAAPFGAAILLSRFALGAVGGIENHPIYSADFKILAMAMSANRRGFLQVLDTGTFITRACDIENRKMHPLDDLTSIEHEELLKRYSKLIHRYQTDATSQSSALAIALQSSITKISGLRIIIDGRDIGPLEMGTQVQILSLVRALADRSDVSSVQLGIPGAIPEYASPFLNSKKIHVFKSPSGDLLEADQADIIHRPSQPSSALPFGAWYSKANRVVVTLQDIISYQVSSYHSQDKDWKDYRDNLVEGVARADAVVSISHETARQIKAEQLPIDQSRLFIVPNGTDHFNGNEPDIIPAELTGQGFKNEDFLLVLGANYGHKNRDIAIRSWRSLKLSYPKMKLILAGVYVPDGSSRIAEAMAIGADNDGLFALSSVNSSERNWLMRQAKIVLYPSSAEGFGLVPFEAAKFGTPTVGIKFPPLSEFNNPPIWSTGWTEIEISDALKKLLDNPETYKEQLEATLEHGSRLSWANTAEGLVSVYRFALSSSSRRIPTLAQLEDQRDAALKEAETYRLSLSYRIGFIITRILRHLCFKKYR
jgi:glycosyltransferase involved in cell wall biosynthesis